MTKRAEELKSNINKIMDCFAGADGGVSFAVFWHTTLPQILQMESNPKNSDVFDKVEESVRVLACLIKG